MLAIPLFTMKYVTMVSPPLSVGTFPMASGSWFKRQPEQLLVSSRASMVRVLSPRGWDIIPILGNSDYYVLQNLKISESYMF